MQRQTLIIAAILLAVAGMATGPACAIVTRDGQDDSLYRSLGSSTAYDSVGRFQGTTPNADFVASGTLVAPEWVLTAAHVVDKAQTLSFSIGGQTYDVDRKIVYPNWNGNLWSGYDISLVHLVKPVDNIKPALIYTGSEELHKTDTVVGFGKTGGADLGELVIDGQKRAALNVISEIENKRLLVADFDKPLPPGAAPLGYAHALPLEGLIAPGDSGGGLFITTSTGTYLAGINSFVGSDYGMPHALFGTFSGHTRVSAFSDWIEARIHGEDPEAAPTCPEDTASQRTTTYPAPEPGSLVLLAAAAVMLGISRCLLRRPAARQAA